MKTFTTEIRTAVSELCRDIPGSRLILAGVSGGADSMAMLHALATGGLPDGMRLAAAHLNHGIRPEAVADADFVECHCRQLGIPFYTAKVDVPALAKEDGVSPEMAARKARYSFFAEIAAAAGAVAVATAHTLDDQAETVLLKLCRGAGSAGLDGIAPRTGICGITVIRPMLKITRASVEEYMSANGLSWREDATNADTAMLRNAIRHNILPQLAGYLNPGIKEALARTADIMRAENDFIEKAARVAYEKTLNANRELNIAALAVLPTALQRRVVRIWLIKSAAAHEMTFDTVERILSITRSNCGTGCLTLSNRQQVNREYNSLKIVPISENSAEADITETVLNVPGVTRLANCELEISATLRRGFERTKPPGIGCYPATAVIRFFEGETIRVRSRRPGDRIHPIGMEGSRKLQDIFIDAKLPQRRRNTIPVFEIDGRIAWIAGYRIAADRAVRHQHDSSLELKVRYIRDEI